MSATVKDLRDFLASWGDSEPVTLAGNGTIVVGRVRVEPGSFALFDVFPPPDSQPGKDGTA